MSTYPKVLIPPLNFSMVESGVYRSGYINKRNHTFLNQLGLKSILYLCHHDYREENLQFVEKHGIEMFYCPIDGNKVRSVLDGFRSMPMIGLGSSQYQSKQSFDCMHVEVRNHPILIHCTKGTHRTGCVVGCLRKLQRWSLTSIISEYCRFAGPRIRLLDQQFIESFPAFIEYDERSSPRWLSS